MDASGGTVHCFPPLGLSRAPSSASPRSTWHGLSGSRARWNGKQRAGRQSVCIYVTSLVLNLDRAVLLAEATHTLLHDDLSPEFSPRTGAVGVHLWTPHGHPKDGSLLIAEDGSELLGEPATSFRPSPVRGRISSPSNSASPPNTVSISRPCAVVVFAQLSPSNWKPALRSAIAPRVLRRSRVERASPAGRAWSPSAPRRLATRPAPCAAGRGRSERRSPSCGTPSYSRPWSAGAPGRPRFGRRSRPVHNHISWLNSAPDLRAKKAKSFQHSNFGA
jgi:hypothetical protein